MKTKDRKAAVEAYRKRKPAAGIYAVRCVSTGAAWVGHAPDLSTIQNRLWFSLRHGGSPHRSLQEAWLGEGADAFAFEVLERFEEEDMAYIRDRLAQERLLHWASELAATRI